MDSFIADGESYDLDQREMHLDIKGVRLILTCEACPEQYDAFLDGQQIGYLRLRHGYFRADYPDCGGETVYEAHTIGDGVFDYDERSKHLKKAVKALKRRHNDSDQSRNL